MPHTHCKHENVVIIAANYAHEWCTFCGALYMPLSDRWRLPSRTNVTAERGSPEQKANAARAGRKGGRYGGKRTSKAASDGVGLFFGDRYK